MTPAWSLLTSVCVPGGRPAPSRPPLGHRPHVPQPQLLQRGPRCPPPWQHCVSLLTLIKKKNKKNYSTVAGNAFSVHLLRLLDYQEMAGWPAARGSEGPARTQREAAGERVVPVPMTPSPLSPRHTACPPSPSQLCPRASGAQDARRGQGWSCSPIWESGGGAEHPSTNLFSILRAGRARRGWSCYGQRNGEFWGWDVRGAVKSLGVPNQSFFWTARVG